MALSERAYEAIAQNILTCLGCGCEVLYRMVEFCEYEPGKFKVTGYVCECGTCVSDGLYMGATAMGH